MGDWILWQKATIDTSSIANGTKIQRIPEGAELLATMFVRAVDIETLSIKIGTAGLQVDIPGRNIALNTDAEPLNFSMIPIMEPSPSNQEIILVSLDSGTGGASAVYMAFQMSDAMKAVVSADT